MRTVKIGGLAIAFLCSLWLHAQDTRSTVLNSIETKPIVGEQRYVEGRLQEHKEAFLFIEYKASKPTYEIANKNGSVVLVDFSRMGSNVHVQDFLNREVYVQGAIESCKGTPNLVIKALNLRLK